MKKPLSTPLPADLPQNWTDTQYVSPGGVEVGLSEKHGYNYQSKQINEAQKAINALNEAFEKALSTEGGTMTGALHMNGDKCYVLGDNNFIGISARGDGSKNRGFHVYSADHIPDLTKAVMFATSDSGVDNQFAIFGQHNKALANREILLKGLNSAPSSDTPGDYPEGVHLYLQTPGGQLKNAPSEYGLMLSMKHNDELTQLWFTQASGTTYRRGGNHLGWASSWTPLSEGVMPATIEE